MKPLFAVEVENAKSVGGWTRISVESTEVKANVRVAEFKLAAGDRAFRVIKV